MADTFLGHVSGIFYDTANKKPEDVSFTLSDKINFSLLTHTTKPEVTIPLPKILDQKYYFNGFVFENSEESRQSIWTLLIASIYHLASHVAISDYSIYGEWCKNKSRDVSWRVIDFIEDAVVARYL
ncbi:MAG TPA: hypothetical protein VLB45_00190, partial [Nitrosopumilaceae archaeon]|nr:hypothetical protein [Nitrosopumilaceae archaeon]